jgi:hypothetical protein
MNAAGAAVVRDLLTDDQYRLLAGPWESVIGPGEKTERTVERPHPVDLTLAAFLAALTGASYRSFPLREGLLVVYVLTVHHSLHQNTELD